jgi:hypothetical protein
LTSGSTSTVLERTANWFGFVGLTLDLIGTSSGVARALLLQAAIRRAHRLTARLTAQIDSMRHRLRELQLRGANTPEDASSRACLEHVLFISRIAALLARDDQFGAQLAENAIAAPIEMGLDYTPGTLPRPLWPEPLRRGRHALHTIHVTLWRLVRQSVHVEGPGRIPIMSLASGALCLFVSVFLYAAKSQERGVWISCTTIAVSVLICSIFPNGNSLRKSQCMCGCVPLND